MKMVFKSKATPRGQVEEKGAAPSSPKAKKLPRPKSPARTKIHRTRSPSKRKSPARLRSPSRRSPARKVETSPPLVASTPKIPTPRARSPIRKSSKSRKSPSRKSPTRAVKLAAAKSAETYFSERVRRQRRNLDVDSDSDYALEQVVEKPQAAVQGRARRLEVQIEKMDIDTMAPQNRIFNVVKRVTRNSQNREVERIVHLKHIDNVVNKLGEFSDQDDEVRKSSSIERGGGDFQQITEFGGPFGALFFTLLIPLSSIALQMLCNEFQCSFRHLPDIRKYLLLSTYFNLTSVLGFVGYATLLAILSVIPFGGKKIAGLPTKQGKFIYVMNGLFSTFVLIATVFALEIWGIPITKFIIEHLFHFLIVSVLFGFVVTIYTYIRSFYRPLSSLNIHVVGRNRIYEFFLGRELNPRIFGLLDMKMYVLRLALIGCLLLNLTHVYTSLPIEDLFDLNALNLNPTLLVLVLIQSIYHLNGLIFEPSWVTSFEIQYEGFGYMSAVGYLIYPFMITSITKYVVDYNVQLAAWKLILIGLVFAFGFWLYRGSNNQKDAFRKNPYDSSLSHLETIPTTKGKKLICSGFWGLVRHPNYLGDILMNLSFAPFALCVPPVLSSICIVILLTHRSVRDNVRCKQKYGAAWDRYCSRVKYVLVPKIY